METPTVTSPQSKVTDIVGLRLSGIFLAGKEPSSIRTHHEWTKVRHLVADTHPDLGRKTG